MFWKDNIKEILEKSNLDEKNMLGRAKERGISIEWDQKKEFTAKIMLETVNRHIFQKLHAMIKAEDLTYSKQPGLIAHPQTIQAMKDGKLDQLGGENFSNFIRDGFISIKDFFETKFYDSIMKPLHKRLLLLEMEGKF